MDRKRVIYLLGWALHALIFLAIYLLIYVKIGRAEGADAFELAIRAQNLIYEETPEQKTRKPSVEAPPSEDEKLQYEPTLQAPAALMSEAAASSEVQGGALYQEGRDLYVNPAGAEPKVTGEPIVEVEGEVTNEVSK
ncbi:MAG: hypothetical protein JST16_05285 [Bdellovibrionales bacterium]|nr:hypothetical protein [Bdellovibrionales bacterium]